MNSISGTSIIGSRRGMAQEAPFRAVNPATGAELPELFHPPTGAEIEQTCQLAAAAAAACRNLPGAQKARLLEAIAANIESRQDEIKVRFTMETGLPAARAAGELGRTTGQLRMFAQLVREGSWVDARIETAQPDRQPVPKPDLRSMRVGLGPVVVFCASNFPLAFSVAGGDTASALAAGCPIVVMAHSAHPGTAVLVGECVAEAVKSCGLPEGVFSLLLGSGRKIGVKLVGHPAIKAAGFTGSRVAGQNLMRIAAQRPEPIPVYAEMSSVNPVILRAGALSERAGEIAKGLSGSLCLGVGQFCTNPGLIFLPEGDSTQAFQEALLQAVRQVQPATMLSSTIAGSYREGVAAKQTQIGVEALHVTETPPGNEGAPAIFKTDVETFVANPVLAEEVFGPCLLLVTHRDDTALVKALLALEGQLTGTLHLGRDDLPLPGVLLNALQDKVGRLIVNQFPTGVEVCPAMVHGGPFPATADGRSTSVGTMAIERFCRPVSFQNFPAELLPPALQNANPEGISRLVNSNLTREPLRT